MTGRQWLESSDLALMFRELEHCDGASGRKMQLFAAACCRRIWHLLDAKCRSAVEVAERYADAQATPEEVSAAALTASDPLTSTVMTALFAQHGRSWYYCAYYAALFSIANGEGGISKGVAATLLRDIAVSPFRPISRLGRRCLAWNGRLIPKMAKAIYDDRAFDRLPVLADALEDAGCTDAAILGHCRGPGPHVRGCWAVDLLLGKG